jgi:hypothetical protein
VISVTVRGRHQRAGTAVAVPAQFRHTREPAGPGEGGAKGLKGPRRAAETSDCMPPRRPGELVII